MLLWMDISYRFFQLACVQVLEAISDFDNKPKVVMALVSQDTLNPVLTALEKHPSPAMADSVDEFVRNIINNVSPESLSCGRSVFFLYDFVLVFVVSDDTIGQLIENKAPEGLKGALDIEDLDEELTGKIHQTIMELKPELLRVPEDPEPQKEEDGAPGVKFDMSLLGLLKRLQEYVFLG